MNTTNANQVLGFDKFSESNYNLHWSFSNFNRMLMAAGQIARLPLESKVLELGAGSSDLENLVKKNFKRTDIQFIKVDGDIQYNCDPTIEVMDITSSECDAYCLSKGPFDCVVFMEVIEHLDKSFADEMFSRISNWLKPECLLLFTTPTPPMEGEYEDRVWPLDHKDEFTIPEIYGIINKYFKVNKEIGWSVEEREFNELLERDHLCQDVYGKLRAAFPESYVRAIIACIAPVRKNRQVFMVCRKRREKVKYDRFA